MINILLTLLVVGIVSWLANMIPMEPKIKTIFNIVLVVLVVIWLLKEFGLWHYLFNSK